MRFVNDRINFSTPFAAHANNKPWNRECTGGGKGVGKRGKGSAAMTERGRSEWHGGQRALLINLIGHK